jgi:hypothetical protein
MARARFFFQLQEDLAKFRQRLAAKGVALMVDFVLPGWRLSWDDAPHDASTDQ